MQSTETDRGWLPAVSVAIRNLVIFVAVLPVPLAAARDLGLSGAQTTSWIFVVYGLTGLINLVLATVYRQPLLTTGNLFALIYVASLGDQFSLAELIGAYVVAGGVVLGISLLGLTDRLAAWLPAPIVFGVLSGAILPFVARIFTLSGASPFLVVGTFVTFLAGYRFLSNRLPPIVPAMAVGLLIAALTGELGSIPPDLALPFPQITWPVFSLPAVLSVTPVVVVLIILQANLPSMVFMRDQGYRPPEGVVDLVSAVGTAAGSLLGPVAVSLSLPATSLVAGAEAGERQFRYRSVLLVGAGSAAIGLLAGPASVLPEIIPEALLLTLAGLAVVGVLVNALQQVVSRKLVLGPVFAFAVATSDINLLGLGPFLWSLLIGTAVSLLLEGDKLRAMRSEAPASAD